MKNGIGKRIDECISKLNVGDGENAFIQLCLAIEGTSKLAYPHIQSSAQRNRQFIKDSMPLVFWSLTNGTPTNSKSFNFMLTINGCQKEVSLEEVMYKLLRCSLVHEATMPDEVEFVNAEYIAVSKDGKLSLPLALISSYCFAIIANPVNKDECLEKNYLIRLYGSETCYNLNNCWGNEEKLRAVIRKGFLYDVEKILDKMNCEKKVQE